MSVDAAHQAAKRGFQTEVARLLHLMVHSVYTEKDVFLRELISNASDACDKLRYNAIADPDLLAGDARLAIRIEADKAAGTLTVADNGIGMDEQELIENLGTIARSGTRAFLDRLSADTDSSTLIGQFGVGFARSHRDVDGPRLRRTHDCEYPAQILQPWCLPGVVETRTADSCRLAGDNGSHRAIRPAVQRRAAARPRRTRRPAAQKF
jgi:hypothetical protein